MICYTITKWKGCERMTEEKHIRSKQEKEESEKRQWHPVFVSSIREALKDADPKQLKIENEVSLTSKPLKIDVLIIQLEKTKTLKNPIAEYFRKWNIIEFKSPVDHLEPTDFDAGIIYARLHQVLENKKEDLLDQYTITLFSSTYPRAMFERIKKRDLIIEESPVKGIYQIKGEMYPIQVVVFNRIEDVEILYPFAPFISSADRGDKRAFIRLMKEKQKDPQDLFVKHILQFSLGNDLIPPIEAKEVFDMLNSMNEQERIEYLEVAKHSWIGEKLKEEGKTEEKKEIARKLLAISINIADICKATGLSEEQIKKLH
jgi:hypothetical protein